MTTKHNRAARIFMIIPPSRMIIFFINDACIKLFLALNSSRLCGFSHLSLTNHPSGIALIVYCVHDLSVQKRATLGGIPIPNSLTWTHDRFAAKKCHNS
jgi:hypothetical protein